MSRTTPEPVLGLASGQTRGRRRAAAGLRPVHDGVDGPRVGIDVPRLGRQKLNLREPSEMQISTMGVDLAKGVFQVHGVDAAGEVVVVRKLKRAQVAKYFAGL